ncbi:MAG: ABC transporter permease [Gemmatimonadetes bacterium]|nr:ABC transporter permease [Gemmatimonadota bacterium]
MMGEDLRQDLRLLIRQVRRRPSFAAVIVLTLAIGVGLNTGVFTVVRAVLLRPLPFPNPGELVTVTGGGASSLPNLQDLRERLRSMRTLAGVFSPQTMTLTGEGDATQLNVSIVTPNFLRMTGLDPAAGRWLGPEDDGTNRAVLSHRVWVTRFGGDPGVVGRNITLDETGVEVVGVAPAEIAVPFGEDVWIADPWPSGRGPRVSRSWRAVNVYGRLAPGWTLSEARKELNTEWARLKQEYPDDNGRWGAGLAPLKEYVTHSEETPLEVLFMASSLLLLLACANVASVFLSRLDTRRHEFAVRSSLGGGRWRLLRQAWTEALALSAAGGLLGVALASLTVGWAVRFLGITLPLTGHLAVDGVVLGFALFITALTAVVVGSVTILAWGTEEPALALRSAARSVVNRSGWLRRTMVVSEVALAFVIVSGLGLLVRSFQRLESVDSGIRPDGVITASLGSFPMSRYPDNDTRRLFESRLTERLRAVPGIEGVALASSRPLAGCCSNGPIQRGDDPERVSRFVESRWVTPSYFQVLGIPIVAGSDFSGLGPGDPAAAIIDKGLAHRLFGDTSPIGATIIHNGQHIRVVGVAGAVREYSPARDAPDMVYFSATQTPMSTLHVVVRTSLPARLAAGGMRKALHDIDPLLPMEHVQTMRDVLDSYTGDQRATTYLMLLLGALALLLGGVGIYGVMSHSVQGSLREIGVRLVLGARRGQMRYRILRTALILVLPGIALGLLGALAASRVVASLLYETSPLDPLVYVLVTALFVLGPLMAAWAPARRAAKVEAAEMLRET